jgi:hypothetical protein
MPSNDREVFEYFSKKPDTSVAVDHLAYASYAFDKYEWMKRFEELQGKAPSESETNNWISHLPNSRLDEIHDDAYIFFEWSARKFMAEEVELEKKKAVDESILKEIERFTSGNAAKIENFVSFKNNWIQNTFIGVISSLFFSVLVIIMAAIFAHDPSPIALYKAIAPAPSQAVIEPH